MLFRPARAGLAILAFGVAGCTGSPASAALDVPPPNIGQVLHANYRADSDTPLRLQGTGSPATYVVTSTGPGLQPNEPIAGGTEDVQLLNFDPIARRWNVAFDAADKVIDDSQLTQPEGAAASGPQALLPQDHRISHVTTQSVQFHPGESSDLLIYGIDEFTNHPPGVLAIVAFTEGNAAVEFYDSEPDMSRPIVTGPPDTQRVVINASFGTSIDPACCPIRRYSQTVASVASTATESQAIGVVEDDRPWLGAWLVTAASSPNGPAIVGDVAASSPASALLRIGDQLIGVKDAPRPANLPEPAVVDQIAMHLSNDHIDLQVTRDGLPLTIPIILSSRASTAYRSAIAPQPAAIGVQASPAPTGLPPGVLVNSVSSGSPAAAAGIVRGDEITAAGPVEVHSVTDLQVALLGHLSQSVELVVRHLDGTATTISTTPQAIPAGDPVQLTPIGA